MHLATLANLSLGSRRLEAVSGNSKPSLGHSKPLARTAPRAPLTAYSHESGSQSPRGDATPWPPRFSGSKGATCRCGEPHVAPALDLHSNLCDARSVQAHRASRHRPGCLRMQRRARKAPQSARALPSNTGPASGQRRTTKMRPACSAGVSNGSTRPSRARCARRTNQARPCTICRSLSGSRTAG